MTNAGFTLGDFRLEMKEKKNFTCISLTDFVPLTWVEGTFVRKYK